MVTFTEQGLHLEILKDFPFEAEIQGPTNKAQISYSGLSFGGNVTMSFSLRVNGGLPMAVSMTDEALYVDGEMDYPESNLLSRHFQKKILELVNSW